MPLKSTITATFLLGTGAFANSACDDLWLSRNVIYDLHGYCFGSTLGKKIFDNTGCTTVEPELPAELNERVQRLWARAEKMSCAANQGRSSISVYNLESRKSLLYQPVASETESACLGFQENPIALYDAPIGDAIHIGTVNTGDDIAWFHQDENNWAFITILKRADGSTPISGWSKQREFPKCDAAAG